VLPPSSGLKCVIREIYPQHCCHPIRVLDVRRIICYKFVPPKQSTKNYNLKFWNVYGSTFLRKHPLYGIVNFASQQCAFPRFTFGKENFGQEENTSVGKAMVFVDLAPCNFVLLTKLEISLEFSSFI
jgi:hypothetical protein